MTDLNILGINLTDDEYSTVNTAVICHYGTDWNNLSVTEKQDIIHDIIGR